MLAFRLNRHDQALVDDLDGLSTIDPENRDERPFGNRPEVRQTFFETDIHRSIDYVAIRHRYDHGHRLHLFLYEVFIIDMGVFP